MEPQRFLKTQLRLHSLSLYREKFPSRVCSRCRYEAKDSDQLKLIDFGFSKVSLGVVLLSFGFHVFLCCFEFNGMMLESLHVSPSIGRDTRSWAVFRWDPNIKMHVSCGTLAYVAPEVNWTVHVYINLIVMASNLVAMASGPPT